MRRCIVLDVDVVVLEEPDVELVVEVMEVDVLLVDVELALVAMMLSWKMVLRSSCMEYCDLLLMKCRRWVRG